MVTPLFLLHHSPKIFKIRRIMLPGRPTLIFTNGHWVINILVFVNVYVAVAEIIICTVILGILWKRMEDQYGG